MFPCASWWSADEVGHVAAALGLEGSLQLVIQEYNEIH